MSEIIPIDKESAYRKRATSAIKARVPTMYKGNLNLLNLSLMVPESTAEGITA